jgi:hypothetical protein
MFGTTEMIDTDSGSGIRVTLASEEGVIIKRDLLVGSTFDNASVGKARGTRRSPWRACTRRWKQFVILCPLALHIVSRA